MPTDPRRPVVCMDETDLQQLIGEVREPLPVEPGPDATRDRGLGRRSESTALSEDAVRSCDRARVAQKVEVEPLTGQPCGCGRAATRQDWARWIELVYMLERRYPEAELVLVRVNAERTESNR